MHRAHRSFCFRAHRAHGGEVVGAHKLGRRPGHHVLVQRLGAEPRPVHMKGVADAGIPDAVGVFLLDTGADGVEFIGDGDGAADHNVRRKTGVHRQRQPVAGNGGAGAEIGDIDLGVHPRVGAAAAGELHRVAYHPLQRVAQGLADGGLGFLNLPAVVGGAHIHQL
ncbi:hypothetical protein SDC9_153144 [bioreactor metagenome]|uniref:Uncharacterized protein n=1 Tax=bioreactor metagenome TaxID=1076179 RepID=A0A645EWS0_9ZZZZ